MVIEMIPMVVADEDDGSMVLSPDGLIVAPLSHRNGFYMQNLFLIT